MKKINTPVVCIKDDFYLAIPINAIWHNFFSTLAMKDEDNCEKLFIKTIVRNNEVWELIKNMHKRS